MWQIKKSVKGSVYIGSHVEQPWELKCTHDWRSQGLGLSWEMAAMNTGSVSPLLQWGHRCVCSQVLDRVRGKACWEVKEKKKKQLWLNIQQANGLHRHYTNLTFNLDVKFKGIWKIMFPIHFFHSSLFSTLFVFFNTAAQEMSPALIHVIPLSIKGEPLFLRI